MSKDGSETYQQTLIREKVLLSESYRSATFVEGLSQRVLRKENSNLVVLKVVIAVTFLAAVIMVLVLVQ